MDNRRTRQLEEQPALVVDQYELRSGLRTDCAQLAGDASEQAETDQERRVVKVGGGDHFAVQIAHDLNNVLNTICGYGALAQRRLGAGETSRYIDNVLKACARARALTQQLFAQSGRASDPESPVCIQRTVEEVLEWVEITLPEGVQVETSLGAREVYVLADPTQLARIVMNLCMNAVHAMERGGVLRVVLDEITVPITKATTHGSLLSGFYVRLSISDTGAGIPPGVLERIFDPFFTTKSVTRGSGLGLAIVRNIVGALGGAIDVSTAVGIGTTFAVWLRTSSAAMGRPSHSQALDVGPSRISSDCR